MNQTQVYSCWQSPIDLKKVFAKPSSPNYLQTNNGCLYWVESLSTEQGRSVICQLDETGNVKTLTPKAYNVRTRVNEYGGRAYLVAKDKVFFCNDSDQNIYIQSLDGGLNVKQLTFTENTFYVDFVLSNDQRYLIFVMEKVLSNSSENITCVAYIDITQKNPQSTVLVEGADFYTGLSVSVENKIAWLEWSHPNMPWDSVACKVAQLHDIDNNLSIRDKQNIINEKNTTAAHTTFLNDGSLILTIDKAESNSHSAENFSNIYCWQDGILKPKTENLGEYSYPHWIFGNHRICQLSKSKLLAIFTDKYGDQLHLIDLESGVIDRVAEEYVSFNHVCSDVKGKGYVVASKVTDETAVLQIDDTSSVTEVAIGKGVSQPFSLNDTSIAQLLTVGDTEKNTCYAYYYAPLNTQYELNDLPPPLLVMVHGGPTARAYPYFDIQKQFWTTSGFAVLDINHRGSSGFGRQYRDALLGEWGVVDAEDIRSSIEYVTEQGLASAKNVFIRGKSAGGYAVQRALTLFPEHFAAGASYYGIGDLVTLADITHKFESHYCDKLLGEVFSSESSNSASSRYFQRSPINHIDKLACPLIVFQGGQDKVVPPALAQQVVEALHKKGIECHYHLYESEGHGFRTKEVLVDSLTKEITFYRQFLSDV